MASCCPNDGILEYWIPFSLYCVLVLEYHFIPSCAHNGCEVANSHTSSTLKISTVNFLLSFFFYLHATDMMMVTNSRTYVIHTQSSSSVIFFRCPSCMRLHARNGCCAVTSSRSPPVLKPNTEHGMLSVFRPDTPTHSRWRAVCSVPKLTSDRLSPLRRCAATWPSACATA